jgi:hypothetical protein
VPLKLIKSFILLQKHCKPPNEISRNFQGNNVYNLRNLEKFWWQIWEILILKMEALYISLKSQENRGFLSNVVLDKWLWIRPKAYLISGMKYYCLYHIIITSIDHINISFILAVVVAKIWICARENSYVLHWDYFISMPSNIS